MHILAAKEQGIGAILTFFVRTAGRCNGGAFTKTVIDITMCAIIAWFIRDLLDFAGLSSNLAYVTCLSAPSVLTRLVRLSNASLLKKRSEDGEINNQRKAFLDMLAWSEELITDVRKPEIMVMTML